MSNFKYISENQANVIKMVLKRLPEIKRNYIEKQLKNITSGETKVIGGEKITLTEAKLLKLKKLLKSKVTDSDIEKSVNSYRELKNNVSKKRSFMRSLNSIKTLDEIEKDIRDKNLLKKQKIESSISKTKEKLKEKLIEYSLREYEKFYNEVKKYNLAKRKTEKRLTTLKRYNRLLKKVNNLNEEIENPSSIYLKNERKSEKITDIPNGVINLTYKYSHYNEEVSDSGRKTSVDMRSSKEIKVSNLYMMLRYMNDKQIKDQRKVIKDLEEEIEKNHFQLNRNSIYGRELYNMWSSFKNQVKNISEKNHNAIKITNFLRYYEGMDEYYDTDIDPHCRLLSLKINKETNRLKYQIDSEYEMTKGYITIMNSKVDINIRLLDPDMKKSIMLKYNKYKSSLEERENVKEKENQISKLVF